MKQVTAAILTHAGRLLIAQRPATDRLSHLWEFPGGKIEADETPEVCLAREMQEEFNIVVEVGEFFGDNLYHYEQGSILLMAYWASWKSGELQAMAHDAYRWVLPTELGNYQFAPADIPFVETLSKFDTFLNKEFDNHAK